MPAWTARVAEAYGLREAREYGRTAWILTAGTLVLGVGRGIVAPFLILFLVQERGIPLAVLGLGITLEFLLRALIGPVAGAVSDRRGRKPLMLVGLGATAVILPSYLLVEDAVGFYALSVANGLVAAHSLYGPASSALLVDVVPRERRGAVFGLIHAARNLGWTIGLAAGAMLIRSGFLPVFVGGGLLPLAILVVVALLVREPARAAPVERPSMFRDWGAVLRRRAFVAYLALSVAFYLAWGVIGTIFPLFLTDGLGLGREAVALLAINTLLIFLLQVPFGRLADRADRLRLLAYAALAIAATYALFVWALPLRGAVGPLLVVSAALVVLTVAEMVFSPILTVQGAELAPERATGSALGILGFAMAIGQGAPPLLADLLVPRYGWGAVWLVLCALTVPSAVGLMALSRSVRRNET